MGHRGGAGENSMSEAFKRAGLKAHAGESARPPTAAHALEHVTEGCDGGISLMKSVST